MISLDEIQIMWKEDSEINIDDLHTESLKVPQLHCKYYEVYNNVSLLRKQALIKHRTIKLERSNYYSGKADPEIYKEEPFPYKVRDKESLIRFVETALSNLSSQESSVASFQQQRLQQQPLGNQPLKGKGTQQMPHGMYGAQPGVKYSPEFASTPNMSNTVRGGTHGYQMLGMSEEEDEMRLLIPDSVIPHNSPWESYKIFEN